jgi:hypothetical protein
MPQSVRLDPDKALNQKIGATYDTWRKDSHQ